MKQYFLILIISFSSALFAEEDKYVCEINQILQLSADGYMEKHAGIFKQLIGQKFSINRETGEMFGLPFTTQPYNKVTVIDHGSKDNSYKAIVTSHPPNMWIMYIYVAEHQQGEKKGFWGTENGNIIYSGLCK